MLALRHTPADAYRRVAVDARIRGGRAEDIVALCFEQVVAELGRALRAHAAGDAGRRSDGLTRAHAALTALDMGLDQSNPVGPALAQLYAAAREAILASVARFDGDALAEVRADFAEIGAALAAAQQQPERLAG